MQNVNVTTSATEILAASTDRRGQEIVLQNQSDTTMRLAFGADNAVLLTASLGLQLEAGESVTIAGSTVMRKISAIHGGSGSKVLHWQTV